MPNQSITLACLLLFSFSTAPLTAETGPSGSPLDYRYYPSGQLLWIWTPQGIRLYRHDTKILKNIVLDDSVPNDPVLDVAENGGALWVTTNSGLYLVDMTTATVEKIPGGPADFVNSKVAADVDFAWVVKSDTLWKFDKLSREWFAFGLARKQQTAAAQMGAYSDGDRVYLIAPSTVYQFSIADEKWSAYPFNNNTFTNKARYYPGSKFLTILEGKTIYRYIMAKLAWDVVTVPSDIIDIQLAKEEIYLLSKTGSFQYSTASSVLRPFDIPDARSAHGISIMGDTVLLAGDKDLIKYSLSSRTIDNFTYPQQMVNAVPLKLLIVDTRILLLYPSDIAVYHPEIKTWEISPFLHVHQKKNLLSWNDDGARMRYSPGCESQLNGSISQLATFRLKDSIYTRDSSWMDPIDTTVFIHKGIPIDTGKVVYYTPAEFGKGLYSDLTLHNTFGKNRYADLFFIKSAGNLPEKGLFYRGDAEDRIESGRLGTNTLNTPLSQTLPAVQYEGASAIVHSESELSTRDRKIIRAQAGGGLKTSKTMYAVLPYNKAGEYNLKDKVDRNHTIIPASLTITVDGEDIDTSQYFFTALNGNLTILRRDLLDPTSVIIASFKVQPKPDSGLETVELLPKNHFGQIDYASATVSPVDWASVMGGYTTIQANSASERRNIATVMMPFEFRNNERDMLCKLTPEVSYETGKQTKAAGLGLQSRVGRWALGKATSFFLDANTEDSSFSTIDTLSRGYGRLLNSVNLKLQHDILTEMPIKYSQTNQVSQYGSEYYREASAGAHFQDLPYLDVIWSQNAIAVDDTTGKHPKDTNTLPDSVILDRDKTKIKVKLYELTSPSVESLLHINKFGYEFSYAHFTSGKESHLSLDTNPTNVSVSRFPGSGNILFGSFNLSPLSSITLTSQTTYKKNMQDSLYYIALRDTFPDTTGNQRDTIRGYDAKRNILSNTEINPSVTFQTIDAPPGIDFNAYYSVDYSGRSVTDTSDFTRLERGLVNIQRKFFLIAKPGTWTPYLSWMSPRFGLSMDLVCKFDSLQPQATAILFGTKGTKNGTFTRNFGIHLYPTDNIVIRQENDYITSDSASNFHMFNDIKWWFGANRLWQTRWEFNAIESGNNTKQEIHKMFTFFDATWSSWLRTNEQLAADFNLIDSIGIDSTQDTTSGIWSYDTVPGTLRRLNMGPELLASFNLQQVGPIKMLLNGHSVKLSWQNENGKFKPGATFSYRISLQLIIRPNISFDTYHSIGFRQGAVSSYYSYLLFKLLF
jgi:hypothetical protein